MSCYFSKHQKNQPKPENVVLSEVKHRFVDNKRTFYPVSSIECSILNSLQMY